MSSHKKTFLWLASVIGGLFVLVVSLLLLLPVFLNMEWVKEKIETEAFQRTGGQMNYQTIDLALLPRPVVTIHQCSFDIPEKMTGSLDFLEVHPAITQLLRGEVKLAAVRVEAPRVTITVPKRATVDRVEPSPSPEWMQRVEGIVTGVAVAIPDYEISVQEGRLDIMEGGSREFGFENITAALDPGADRAAIEVSATSDLCEAISFRASLTRENLQGEGKLELKGLRAHRIADRFLNETSFQLADSRSDVALAFQLQKDPEVQAQLKINVPSMILHKKEEAITIRGLRLEAGLTASRDACAVVIKKVNVEAPALAASGRIDYSGKVPRMSVDLVARGVDVASVRQVVLTLDGGESTVQDVFEVLRAGIVPEVTIQADVPNAAGLTEFENLVIRGNITKGEVFIPQEYTGLEGVDFDLKEVQAEALISQGVLEAGNAEARWEKTKARDGIVKVDLGGDENRLYIEAVAEVDLSELPVLQKRLIQSDAVARELARTRDIRGSAVARFVLDDRTQPMTIQVDVSELHMALPHELLPHEVKISSGQVSYEAERIQVKNFQGAMGPSSFSDLSLTVELGKSPSLEVQSGELNLSVTDLYPWVTAIGPVTKTFGEYVRQSAGTLLCSIHHLRMPLTNIHFQTVDYDVSGVMKDVVLISPLLPAKVYVAEGEFDETGDTFRLTDAKAEMLDSSLIVNLALPSYQRGIDRLVASFQGRLGEEGLNWASDLVDAPPELRVRPPLDVNQAHVRWTRRGGTRLSADVTINQDPRLHVEGGLDAGELDIEQLTIRDPDSQVTMGFHLEERELHLDWDGRLSHATMDRILVRNQVLAGVVEGDFDAHIYLDRPMKSTATGRLHGVGLGRNLGLRVPLTIEDVVLDAQGKTLEVESTRVTWGDTHLDVAGQVAFSENYFVVDMDVTGDTLHLHQIRDIVNEEEGEREKEEESIIVPPVDGLIRIELDRVATDFAEFSPVRARVDLDSDRLTIDLTETRFCNTEGMGTLKVTPQEMTLDLTLTGEGPDVDPLIRCLTEKRWQATGSYTFQAKLSGKGTVKTLADSLRGTWNFEAKDGRILKSNSLTRILAYLHVIGILKGRYPGLGEEGFEYHSIRSTAEIQGRKLLVKEFHLDGVTLDVAATGQVDVMERTIDLTALAAPFTTLERVVGWIPGLQYIMGGSLIAVPVKVSGKVNNIQVTPLAPSAIGSSLMGIMGRIITAPVKIIQPAFSEETK
jgi:hypothetical protein